MWPGPQPVSNPSMSTSMFPPMLRPCCIILILPFFLIFFHLYDRKHFWAVLITRGHYLQETVVIGIFLKQEKTTSGWEEALNRKEKCINPFLTNLLLCWFRIFVRMFLVQMKRLKLLPNSWNASTHETCICCWRCCADVVQVVKISVRWEQIIFSWTPPVKKNKEQQQQHLSFIGKNLNEIFIHCVTHSDSASQHVQGKKLLCTHTHTHTHTQEL